MATQYILSYFDIDLSVGHFSHKLLAVDFLVT